MQKSEILKNLESLYTQNEVSKGFPDKDSCLRWVSKVTPLLKFSDEHYSNFRQYGHQLHANLSRSGYITRFRLMVSQIEMAIEELKMNITDESEHLDPVKINNPAGTYISESRIEELIAIKSNNFDLSKLIQIAKEMNRTHREKCYYSMIGLTRAMIDHVPPIFKCKNFTELANNYSGTSSFKTSMQHLEKSSRNIANQHLHSQIRNSEVIPNMQQGRFFK